MLVYLIAACMEPLSASHLLPVDMVRLCITCKTLKKELYDPSGIVMRTLMATLGRLPAPRRTPKWVNSLMINISTRCHYCMKKTGCRPCNRNSGKVVLCSGCCGSELVDRNQVIYMWVKYTSYSGFNIRKHYILSMIKKLMISKISKRSKAYLFWRKDVVNQIKNYHTSRVLLNSPRLVKV